MRCHAALAADGGPSLTCVDLRWPSCACVGLCSALVMVLACW